MIIIGIVLLILGSLVFVFAWRGRIVARGQFCRRCKFDLAGLDIDSTESKCPECGSEVQNESRRKGVRRERSMLGVIAASVLLFGGVSLLGVGASGAGNIVLRHLPDTTVFWLNDLGVDEALDELVIRVSRSSNPIAQELHTRAIVDALAHQADTSQTWDPRWGEVLSVSFGNPVMTDEQMKQYIRNAMDVSAEIRDRVYQDAQSVDITIRTKLSRMSALNLNDTGYWMFNKPVKGGVVGEPVHAYLKNAGLGTNFYVSQRGQSSLSWDGTIPIDSGFDVEPGTLVPVYIEYELMFSEIGVIGHFRTEEMVMVLAEDDPVVPEYMDPVMAQLFCESISISTIRVIKEVPDIDPMRGHSVLAFRTQFEPVHAYTAFDVYFRFDDGELIRIGPWVNRRLESNNGILTWPGGIFLESVRAKSLPIVERLISEGKVDVIMQTNSALANDIPGVDRVLNVSLEFLNIPVEVVEKEFDLQKSAQDSAQQFPGECP